MPCLCLESYGEKMLNICNEDSESFMNKIINKNLFLYGAGIRATKFFEEYNLKKSLIAVIDNNEDLQGRNFYCDEERKIEIISLDQFVKYVESIGKDNIVLLITPAFYTINILKQLNEIAELSGMTCYIGELLMNFYKEKEFEFTKRKEKIPRKIHYCWFGKNRIPDELQYCINSWRKKCPDYEIIGWDESNYDITKNRYMYEAYECKKWGFVPDFARLDIIYNEGGIYLDTDVELLNKFDNLLSDEAFFGRSGELCIAMGLGFGAVKNHNFIKKLKDVYEEQRFYNLDGSLNMKPCTYYQHPIFKLYGFSLKNEYQNKHNIAIYPSEVFAPLGIMGGNHNFTEKTIAIHHGSFSWITKEEYANVERYRNYVSNL